MRVFRWTIEEQWREEAACKGQPIDLFFPPSSLKNDHPLILEAKAICYRCPVSKQCLEASDGQFGIWGGKTQSERRNDA